MGWVFGKKKRLLVKCSFGFIPFRVNYYDGCSNGCTYCCGCLMCERFIPQFDYKKWLKPKLVKNALEIFEKNLASSRTKDEVFTQSLSDSYMDSADPDVTREILDLMKKYDFPILLLTKNVSVIEDLDSLPKTFLFYRQQLQFLGGMGIVVLAVAILPMLGVGGMQLYRAETPGPMKDSKLTPRIAQTAKALWSIYMLLTLLCTFLFMLAGMDWFDALGESFATVSTGGFSMHNNSFSYYHSDMIELICLIILSIILALLLLFRIFAWYFFIKTKNKDYL